MFIRYVSHGFLLVLLLSLVFTTPTYSGDNDKKFGTGSDGDVNKFNFSKTNGWVDSTFNEMTPDQRLGQLFMVAAYSNKDQEHTKEIANLVKNYCIGGLMFLQGGPLSQANLTNYYQSLSNIPLLISIDAEWGLSMRLDSTLRFPRQMALGAISDDNLIYQFGLEMAKQCKRMGIHINFAPVVDVNNNPKNPVINERSFGEDKFNVAGKSIAYMQGMQDGGIMANAKHFPGHGNTDKDSHKTLPTVNRTRQEIDSIELYPFRQLFSRGLSSIMVAHLFIPALDTTANTASTLSKKVVTDLLKTEMNFKGLVFTDALNMKGVSAFYAPGYLDVKALIAGNDMLLFAEDVPTAISEIKKAMEAGEITQDEIDIKVRKILMAKYMVGLSKYKPIRMYNLYEDLNSNRSKVLDRHLTEASLTLLKNKNNIIPFTRLDTQRIAALSIGADIDNVFLNTLANYAPLKKFSIGSTDFMMDYNFLEANLSAYNTIIIGVHSTSRSDAKNYGITEPMKTFINKLNEKIKVVLVVFGNAYSLRNFEGIEPIVMAYEDNDDTRSLAAQLLFGGIPAKGKLPVTASPVFKRGEGVIIDKSIRLKYTLPEETGIAAESLKKIDRIVGEALKKNATPGCQVLVAKDGKVIYNKAFGDQTYGGEPVQTTDLYDLASITKIAASTISLMKLYDVNELEIERRISYYLEDLKKSNKQHLMIGDILTHQAGLKSWVPFWKGSMDTDKTKLPNYSKDSSELYSVRVASNLYLRCDYPDTIWNTIINSKVEKPGKYVYSDLGFYIMQRLIEHQAEQSIASYVNDNFYKPLGLATMGYLPRKRVEMGRIVPTEYDRAFRKQLIYGDVHDPGAAMEGGIAGHAGLFSDANDLATLMQMLLNKGEYGGHRYLKAETIKKFTSQYTAGNRRGLGFDKPEMSIFKGTPTSRKASAEAFGHTGFTGTCTWVDPKYNLVYVFLSNRVYPDAENKKLVDMNVRTDIQEAIYESIEKGLK